jgi:hypothetical protein
MGRHAIATFLGIAALSAILACLAASARADEASYCVTCSGPDQIYRCRVTGEGSKPSDALKLYCVIRTAKEGHHASCSAENATPACSGVEKVYSYDGPSIPDDVAQDPRVKNLMSRIDHENQAFDKPKGKAPQTMVELTGRAFSASRQGLRNARSALGGSSGETQPLPVSPQAGSTEASAASSAATPSPSRVQRASSAMGSLARKSYRCLRSLFRNCGGEAATGSTVQ